MGELRDPPYTPRKIPSAIRRLHVHARFGFETAGVPGYLRRDLHNSISSSNRRRNCLHLLRGNEKTFRQRSTSYVHRLITAAQQQQIISISSSYNMHCLSTSGYDGILLAANALFCKLFEGESVRSHPLKLGSLQGKRGGPAEPFPKQLPA